MDNYGIRKGIWRIVPGLVLAGGGILGWSLSVAEAAEPAMSVKHYDLAIALDPVAKRVDGSVGIRFTCAAPACAQLQLDMDQALEVKNLSLDGVTAAFTRDQEVLKVTLPAAGLPAGEHLLQVDYAGQPEPRRLRFDTDPTGQYVASYGLPYSARQWWPEFDDPAIKAASADIHITVPEGLTAVSNGRLVGVTLLPDRRHRYHWTVAYPIYADVISVAAAPYVEFDDEYRSVTGTPVPLHYFVFPADLAKARVEFAIIPSVLGVYETLFGPYPFQGEQYGITEMMLSSFREHQTVPALGKSFIEAPSASTETEDVSTVIAHDLAHQWFGNSLTLRSWSDIWLNESFSNYAVALWHERRDGAADYHTFMRELDTHDFTGSPYVQDPHDFMAMFGSTTFNKGAWVLHMLRHVMGDAGFFAALRDYTAANRYGHVDTATWMSACERQYGKPLDWFFKEWVYGEGRPDIKMVWNQEGGALVLKVVQTQQGQVFTMPVDVEIETEAGRTREVVWLRGREENLHVPVDGVVKSVSLDPDGWLLKG